MRKITTSIVVVIIAVFMCSLAVSADGNGVMEARTNEDSIALYVRGDAVDSSASAQIGTSDAERVEGNMISDMEVSMQTLVMIDNSISIKKNDRDKIEDFLQNLISDRIINSQIAIATFDEEIRYVCDYTSEYADLKNAISNIAYNDQNTYLSDVLYDVVIRDFDDGEEAFKRVVIISDGVDSKSLGITKEELYTQLRKTSYPVYTIGCTNKNKSNNESLENMFALSRITGATDFLLDDIEDTMEIVSLLKEESSIVRYIIRPQASQMDGTTKAIRLTAGGITYETEYKMPQVLVAVEEPEKVEEEQISPAVEEPVVEPAPKSNTTIVIISAITVLIIIIIIVAIMLIKKKKNDNRFESYTGEQPVMNLASSNNVDCSSDERTVILRDNDSQTQALWGDGAIRSSAAYNIVLTDVKSPSKTYQIPIYNTVVLGRSKECDVVFDSEKSVSRKHCEIRNNGGTFYIRDLQTSNHTYLNDSMVLNEVEIISGNIIKMGNLELRFEVR